MSYHGTHVVVIEIPEGSLGAAGQTIDTEKISKLIGATQGPKRLAEALTRKNHGGCQRPPDRSDELIAG